MLELVVQTDPGEKGKKIVLDGRLRGSSSESGSNFNELLKEYTLDGKKILGTKAVVLNMDALTNYLVQEYDLNEEIIEGIQEQYTATLKNFQNSEGYWSCFWDKTSEVHHRDIMRFGYDQIRIAVESYKNILDSSEIETEEQLEYVIQLTDKLEQVEKDMNRALEELYIIKVGDTELSDMAVKMLECAQGYQLSSETLENSADLWRSRIRRLQLDSGITQDQKKQGIYISPEENLANLSCFVESLESAELKTGEIEVPQTHQLPVSEISIDSVLVHKNRSGYVSRIQPKNLRITYQN